MTRKHTTAFLRFSREHDEAVLDWIARMEAKEPIRSIAADYDCSPGTISRAVSAVLWP
jgi:hypothetical protein